MPTEKDIGKAYRDYYTHEDENTKKPKKRSSAFKRLKRALYVARGTGCLALRYDTACGTSALEKLAGLLVYLYPIRKAALDFKVMYPRVKSGARLLEIGCGGGRQLAEWLLLQAGMDRGEEVIMICGCGGEERTTMF